LLSFEPGCHLLTPYRRESAWLAPRPLLQALRARSGLLLLAFGVLFGCLAALIYSLPKGYESRMELVLSSEPGKAQVNSEIEFLKSTDVLTKVVLKTGLQKLEMAEHQLTGETSPVYGR
jgi:uncharacterized protein involved in exopolysaccharide biosynthesis